jgi:hypothetical protein
VIPDEAKAAIEQKFTSTNKLLEKAVCGMAIKGAEIAAPFIKRQLLLDLADEVDAEIVFSRWLREKADKQ